MLGRDSAENCGGSAVGAHRQGGRCSCYAGRRRSVQLLDTVIDMPVVVHVVFVVLKTVEVPQLQYFTRSSTFLRAVRRQCGRPCDHAATRCLFNSRGASDSVHRQSRGHSCCATETVLAAVLGMAAVLAFSAVLTPFFALLRLSRS